MLCSPSQASLFEKVQICNSTEGVRASVVAFFLLFYNTKLCTPLLFWNKFLRPDCERVQSLDIWNYYFIEIHRKIKANVSTPHYTFKRLSYQCNITVTFQWLWKYKTTDKHRQYKASLSNELQNIFLVMLFMTWNQNSFAFLYLE